jgi:hypothetical protein
VVITDRNSIFFGRKPQILVRVIHNDHVYKFLWVLRIFKFTAQNPNVSAFGFNKNASLWQNRTKLHIS